MPKRVLIVEPSTTNGLVLKNGLSDAYYMVLHAPTGEEGLACARRDRPDLILLSLSLPDLSGIEVLARLKSDVSCRNIPVIGLLAQEEASLALSALEAGADDVLRQPLDPLVLKARIRNLVRFRRNSDILGQLGGELQPLMTHLYEPEARYDPAPQVTIIARDASTALRWRNRLPAATRAQSQILTAHAAMNVLAAATSPAPDIVLIDAYGPEPDKLLRLMTEISALQPFSNTMFCVALPEGDRLHRANALDLEAHEIIAAEIDAEELHARLAVLFRRKSAADTARLGLERSLRMAAIDPLTGAFNRRYALPRLTEIADTALSEAVPFSLLLLDIDHFKSVNDCHGHAAGDHILVEVVQRLRRSLRPQDLLARIGGEEFLIALPRRGEEEARQIAEALRHDIAAEAFAVPRSATRIAISVSIGVADGACLGGATNPEAISALINMADDALIRAKSGGRNRIAFGGGYETAPLDIRL